MEVYQEIEDDLSQNFSVEGGGGHVILVGLRFGGETKLFAFLI